MPDRVVLDVIDRPAVGLRRVVMHARATRASGPRACARCRASEVVRAACTGPWKGWMPDAVGARPLADDEPALILIAGDLYARPVPYADAKEYAFNAGDHAEAMRRDRRDERHKTEWFLRLRPLAERGTLVGTTPLGPVLATTAAA